MSQRAVWLIALWSVTAAAVGLEVYGAAANTGATWTESITRLPWWAVIPAVATLAVWMVYHFVSWYVDRRSQR